LLEFVDMGDVRPPAGTLLQTDYALSAEDANADSASEDAPEIYHTVMTGSALKEVFVNQPQTGQFQIAFELESEGSDIFAEYTKNNIGKVLAIVLDKEVISAPTIQSEISGGSGVITGQFDYDSANALVVNCAMALCQSRSKLLTAAFSGQHSEKSPCNALCKLA
jgi:preprotein translocase subunit SecD